METKYNEATRNRPEGTRVIDASFVLMDIEKYSNQLKSEEAWEKSDRNSLTMFKTDGTTIVLTWLHRNAAVIDNSVEGLMTIQVLEGVVDFTLKDNIDIVSVKSNQLITIHPGLYHSIHAKQDTLLLITNNSVS